MARRSVRSTSLATACTLSVFLVVGCANDGELMVADNSLLMISTQSLALNASAAIGHPLAFGTELRFRYPSTLYDALGVPDCGGVLGGYEARIDDRVDPSIEIISETRAGLFSSIPGPCRVVLHLRWKPSAEEAHILSLWRHGHRLGGLAWVYVQEVRDVSLRLREAPGVRAVVEGGWYALKVSGSAEEPGYSPIDFGEVAWTTSNAEVAQVRDSNVPAWVDRDAWSGLHALGPGDAILRGTTHTGLVAEGQFTVVGEQQIRELVFHDPISGEYFRDGDTVTFSLDDASVRLNVLAATDVPGLTMAVLDYGRLERIGHFSESKIVRACASFLELEACVHAAE